VDGYDTSGNRVYDKVSGQTCHQCRQKTLGRHTACSECQTLHVRRHTHPRACWESGQRGSRGVRPPVALA